VQYLISKQFKMKYIKSLVLVQSHDVERANKMSSLQMHMHEAIPYTNIHMLS